MEIAKVIKKVVSTVKNESFNGRPLLLVQPLNIDFSPNGSEVMCIDFMGADIDEIVLIMKEGGSINDLLNTSHSPADAAIIAIVDDIMLDEKKIFEKSNIQPS